MTRAFLLLPVVFAVAVLLATLAGTVSAQDTPPPVRNENTTDPTTPGPNGGIIEAAAFYNLVQDGYVSIIISYNAPLDVYCQALADFHNCPGTSNFRNIRSNQIGFLYSKDCDNPDNCDDHLTAWRRIPNLGPGIGAVHYKTEVFDAVGQHRVCLRSPVGLGPPDGCKLVQVNGLLLGKEIQDNEFKRWLPEFMLAFGERAQFTPGAYGSDGVSFTLTPAGLIYIENALPRFRDDYPQLLSSELEQLRTADGTFDAQGASQPVLDFLRQDNAEIREAASGVAGQLGFDGPTAMIIIAATVVAIIGAVIIIRKVNAWTAVLWVFLTYLVTLFVAPEIFTGFVALVIVVAFAIGTKLQRRFSQ